MARNGVHACTATGTLRRKEARHESRDNGYLWRHQLTGLGDTRRCIAVDLLAHGSTNIKPDQDVAYWSVMTVAALSPSLCRELS
jgi:hypothetical protein